MKLTTVVAALLVALAGCGDITQPSREIPAPVGSGAKWDHSAVLVAAQRDVPIATDMGIQIGVLDAAATRTTRLVTYRSAEAYERYKFELHGGQWTRGERLERRDLKGGAEGMSFSLSPSGPYKPAIAKIKDGATWYTDASSAGDYVESHTYGKGLDLGHYSAEFYPGVQYVDNVRYEVSNPRWSASRTDPGHGWSSNDNKISTMHYECYFSVCAWWGAHTYTLTYRMDVFVLPSFQVSVSGPDYVSADGTYTWEAMPTGGNGTYTYQWEVEWHDLGYRSAMGTGKTQTLDLIAADGDITLHVTAYSGTEQAQGLLPVCNFIYPNTAGGC